MLILHKVCLHIYSTGRVLFNGFIYCLLGLRKSERRISGMQTLLRETDFSKSLEKFPVVYDRNPHEVGHNSVFILFIEPSLII